MKKVVQGRAWQGKSVATKSKENLWIDFVLENKNSHTGIFTPICLHYTR